MNRAWCVVTKKSVRATTAPRRFRSDYICLECRQPVFLSRGKIQEPCFRHYHQDEPPHCNLLTGYEASDEEFEATSGFKRVALSLRVLRDRRSRQAWQLFLRLPQCDKYSSGSVAVRCSLNVQRTISVATMLEGPFDVPIIPDTGDYYLSAAERYGDQYLREFASGGRAAKLNVPASAFTSNLSEKSEAAPILYWSRAYFLICRATYSIPESLEPAMIQTDSESADYQEWSCVRIALPAKPNEELRMWLTDTTRLDVEDPPIKASLLFPFQFGVGQGHEPIRSIRQTQKYLFALHRRSGIDMDKHFFAIRMGDEQSFTLASARSTTLLQVMCDDPQEFGLDYGFSEIAEGMEWLPLASYRPNRLARLTADIALDIAYATEVRSMSILDSDLALCFGDVRMGQAEIVGFRGEAPLSGEIRVRRSGTLRWKNMLVLGSLNLSDAVLLLNQVLRNAFTDVELVIPGLGSARLLGSSLRYAVTASMPQFTDHLLLQRIRLSDDRLRPFQENYRAANVTPKVVLSAKPDNAIRARAVNRRNRQHL